MFESPFSFKGRIRRREYGISFVIYLIMWLFLKWAGFENTDPLIILLMLPVSFFTVWFLWAQGAKRCHDLSYSGWYQIIPLFVLLLIFQQGVLGENDYGHDPRQPAEEEEDQPVSMKPLLSDEGNGDA